MLSPLKKVVLDAVPVADNIAMSTASVAIVNAVEPVTSPVCVRLVFVTLAVLATTAVSKLATFGIATVPVNVGLANVALSPNAVVIVAA